MSPTQMKAHISPSLTKGRYKRVSSYPAIKTQYPFHLSFDRSPVNATMKFRYAMVCSSNQNRSMEAHSLLKKQGFDVSSYGTGAHVKLPGPSLREPNVYEFGTPYKHMFDDLRRKDPDLYPLSSISRFFLFVSQEKNISEGNKKNYLFIYLF